MSEIRDNVLMMWRIIKRGYPYIGELLKPQDLAMFNIDNLPVEEIKYISPMYRKA